MNSKLRKEVKNEFENNYVFGKTIESQRNYGDIELVTTERRSIIDRLLHHKVFHQKFACNRNGKDTQNYE